MTVKAWLVAGTVALGLALPKVAGACGGGGVVSSRPGSVGANAQRVFMAVHDEVGAGGSPDAGPTKTEVVTVIDVPETTNDYGALLPLPSVPTLDPAPVDTAEFDALGDATEPELYVYDESDGGGGCGCGSDAGSDSTGGGVVTESVDIGPVTAVVLTGETEAVNVWLEENGFVLSRQDQATIAAHAGYHFVAIKRNDTAAPGGPSSIGIHFTMEGDHRELPLAFARIGASSTVTFTLFLASREATRPSAPFEALTLQDLSGDVIRDQGYRAAVAAAVRANGNQAFLLESSRPESELGLEGTIIGSLIQPGSKVTRLTTILPVTALTENVGFYEPVDFEVPNERFLSVGRKAGAVEAGMGAFGLLLALGLRRRRPA